MVSAQPDYASTVGGEANTLVGHGVVECSSKVELKEQRYRAYQQAWREANRAKACASSQAWREANPGRSAAASSAWCKENKERFNATQRARKKVRRITDPSFRIVESLRTRITTALRRKGGFRKATSTFTLIGCSAGELRQFLEEQFQTGMTWENYGKYGWHIDHVRPCASFNMIDSEQQRICFHYTNLQPLWAVDNIRKGAH